MFLPSCLLSRQGQSLLCTDRSSLEPPCSFTVQGTGPQCQRGTMSRHPTPYITHVSSPEITQLPPPPSSSGICSQRRTQRESNVSTRHTHTYTHNCQTPYRRLPTQPSQSITARSALSTLQKEPRGAVRVPTAKGRRRQTKQQQGKTASTGTAAAKQSDKTLKLMPGTTSQHTLLCDQKAHSS